MRKLIVIGDDLYVRSFVQSGAFAAIDGDETYFVGAGSMQKLAELEQHPNYVGAVDDPPLRYERYARIRAILVAAYRFRSRTLRLKTRQLAWKTRLDLKVHALPGIRKRTIDALLDEIGLNDDFQRVLRDVRPDVVIAPTAGTDVLVIDAVRGARAEGVPSMLLINGWDNLSSKTTFSVRPDYLGVWGEQSVEHAVRIHGMPRDRVFPIGVPTFQQYFGFDPAEQPSPYPFRYVLFSGCALPFDELTALRELDRVVEEMGDDRLKIVYRPHPWRQPRACPDLFREEDFRHVVIDAQVRDAYYEAARQGRTLGPAEILPSLDYYPSLIGHAQFVVSPLSTMLVEAALLERPVLVIAYDDFVHDMPPSLVAKFDHFAGIEEIDGFSFCRRLDQLGEAFERMPPARHGSLRDQVREWLFFDDDSYAVRLARLIDELFPSRRSVVSAGAPHD